MRVTFVVGCGVLVFCALPWGSGHAIRAEMGDLVADAAFGQSGLFESAGTPVGWASFAEPRGIAIDRSVTPNRAYVSDSAYSRILGWSDVDAMANGAPADLVIGQSGPSEIGCNGVAGASFPGAPATLSNLCHPQGIAVDSSGSLYVSDRDNCRVLVYLDPFASDATADLVLGSCDSVSATSLYYPSGVAVDAGGNVFVADRLNCRVLEYDGPLTSTDVVADRVYLEPDLNARCTTPTRYQPYDVAVGASGTLFVATATKVLRVDDALSETTVDASFGTDGCNTEGCNSTGCTINGESAVTTCRPTGVATDTSGRLYIGDAGNNRVLAFDTPLTSPIPQRIYGQPDFGGNSGLFNDECNEGGPSASSLCTFQTIPLTLGGSFIEGVGLDTDDAGRLYVADTLNHRVLRYDDPVADSVADLVLGHVTMDDVRRPMPTIEVPNLALDGSRLVAADATQSRILLYESVHLRATAPFGVIGQPDFAAVGCNSGGLSASSLCNPEAVFVDRYGDLWIADTGNNRVLLFASPWAERSFGQAAYVIKTTADAVYGQPDFVSNGCAAGASGLCAPRGLALDTGRNLYISDSGNNRILRYDDALNDAAADAVIGQPDFAGSACNSGGVSGDSLCRPRGIAIDAAGDMFVADAGNNRVLVYQEVDAFPGGADAVFGQDGSFTTAGCGVGPGGLCDPSAVAFDSADQLLVADTGNHRVLQYDLPFADTAADRVLGQPDMTSASCNTGGVSDTSLCSPLSVAAYRSFGDKIIVGDAGNQRIVRYDAPYCVSDYLLDWANPAVPEASGPRKTKVKLKRRGAGQDQLKLRGKIRLFESDPGNVFCDEPLVSLSAQSGVAFREAVPNLGGGWLRGETEVCKTEYLKGEVDNGFDDFKSVDRFKFNPRQRNEVSWRGRAVGLDFTSFTDTSATLQLQFGSTCYTTALACRHRPRSSSCKSP